MKALDTTTLVRYYTADDADQHAAVLRVLKTEAALFVPKTVVLELWWALTRSKKYMFSSEQAYEVVTHLAGLDAIVIEDIEAVMKALQWQKNGLDFPDALHLAASAGCTEMLTFDNEKFARRANRLNLKPACIIPA